MNLNVILAIFRKDLIYSTKNKNILLILLIPIFLSILSTSTFSMTENIKVPIAVYDEGSSEDFVNHLKHIDSYEVIVTGSIGKAKELLYKEEVAAAVIIPEGFSAALKRGLVPSLNIIVNPYDTKSTLFLRMYKDAIMDFAGQKYPVSVSLNTFPAGLQSRLNIPTWVMFAIIFVGMMVLPNTLTTEKEKKTLDAILVSPASEKDIIYGKSFFGLFLTILISLVMIFINGGFTGNFLLFLLFIILGSTFFTGLGLLIASYTENYSSASLLSTIFMIPFLLLPLLANLSPEIRYFSHFVPSTYILNGITDSMLTNSGISDLYSALGALIVFNVFVYTLTTYVLWKKSYV
jgi:ABC-2 type transport system permease protein